MNKFKYYFILIITTITLFSCTTNDTATVVPIKDYEDQFKVDSSNIDRYLKTYYITVVDNPGARDDQDVTFTKIETGDTTHKSIWDQTTYELKSKIVKLHDIEYKLYYLVLRKGTGESPTNADGVLAAYRGDYLTSETVSDVINITATKFEEVKFPDEILNLLTTIKGWSETFPEFKTGKSEGDETNGTVTHTDFGAGVIFIPSGLAYYNNPSGTIPAYSPLVFSFKLYQIQRLDSDGDGIFNYQEDNGDGYMYDYRNLVNYPTTPTTNPDDTDKDGIPDFLDFDDDGDNYTTKLELQKPDGTHHTFETVPSCSGQTLKRYLTSSCKPPYTE